jgi:hypothetical protein
MITFEQDTGLTAWLGVVSPEKESSTSIPPPAKFYSLGSRDLSGGNVYAPFELSWDYGATAATATSALSNLAWGDLFGNIWLGWAVTTDNTTVTNVTTTWNSVAPATYITANTFTQPPPFSSHVIKKSERLLKGILTSKQRRQWERFRYITVQSPRAPGVVYKIPDDGKIRMFEDGKPVTDLCIYPVEYLPIGDRVATLKLMVEADEDEFLKVAIRHEIRPPGAHFVPANGHHNMMFVLGPAPAMA